MAVSRGTVARSAGGTGEGVGVVGTAGAALGASDLRAIGGAELMTIVGAVTAAVAVMVTIPGPAGPLPWPT